jgi:hypothetical protein
VVPPRALPCGCRHCVDLLAGLAVRKCLPALPSHARVLLQVPLRHAAQRGGLLPAHGESFLRVHWVAVPKAMGARRVNTRPCRPPSPCGCTGCRWTSRRPSRWYSAHWASASRCCCLCLPSENAARTPAASEMCMKSSEVNSMNCIRRSLCETVRATTQMPNVAFPSPSANCSHLRSYLALDNLLGLEWHRRLGVILLLVMLA